MTGGYVGSILSWLASNKTYNSFVQVGFVDANGVRVPVGGAQGWGACGGGDEFTLVTVKLCCIYV